MDFKEELKYCVTRMENLMNKYLMRFVDEDHTHVRKVKLLARTCREDLKQVIHTSEIDIPQTSKEAAIKAFCVNMKGEYWVCVEKTENSCWRRFYTCKELFHIVLDKPEYHSLDLAAHVAEMTTSVFGEESPSPAVVVEHLAEIGAMEYMMPYRVRANEISTLKDNNYLPIAEKYKVPLVKVEKYLSKSHMDYLRDYAPSYNK